MFSAGLKIFLVNFSDIRKSLHHIILLSVFIMLFGRNISEYFNFMYHDSKK